MDVEAQGGSAQQQQQQQSEPPGSLSWRLSSHPITLLTLLCFRSASIVFYLLSSPFNFSFVFTFIITILLLSLDFYYLKNIAGRRLVGLRWWNEVLPATTTASGTSSKWVFESAEGGSRIPNATDSRFFWLAVYAVPVAWGVLAILAIVRFSFVWLILIVIAMVLSITNAIAFSRCDRFSQASNLATSAMGMGMAGGLAGNIASRVVGRFFG